MSMSTVSLLILFALFLLGCPIALAMMIAVIPYFASTNSIPMDMIVQKIIAQTESNALMAVPFFIIGGSLMNASGITRRLMNLADMLVGHMRGGLGHVNVILSTIMGGMSGSCAADASMQCKILVPEMLKHGYDKPFSAAVTAASSLITTIIPPGIGLIVYAYATDCSVGKMFSAGYIPGFLMMLTQMALVGYLARKRNYPRSREKAAPFREVAPALIDSLWALALPFVLIPGLRLGIFNATEGGAIMAGYAAFVGFFIYKDLKLKDLPGILIEAMLSTAAVMFVMCGAAVLTFFMSWERIPQAVSKFILAYASNRYVFLFSIVLLFIFIGMFMDGTTAMMILAPLVAPVARSLQIDLVQMGILMVMLCSLGTLTPPFGAVIYLVAPLLKMRVEDFMKENFMFIGVIMIVVVMVTLIPPLTTFLPNLIFG